MEVTINVPTSLKEITLQDYQRFLQIETEDKNTIRKMMVHIFCKVPLQDVNKMKRNDFVSISNSLSLVLQEKPKLEKFATLDGKKFGFIPNLSEMTAGEYIDLDKYPSDWQNMHKAMAVLYRPITFNKKDKYLIENYEGSAKYSNLMLSMPMDIVMGAIVFFWILSKTLLDVTPKFLESKLKEKKYREALEQNGVGISTYINSLKETSSALTRLLDYQLGVS